jgi:hypothetical protein
MASPAARLAVRPKHRVIVGLRGNDILLSPHQQCFASSRPVSPPAAPPAVEQALRKTNPEGASHLSALAVKPASMANGR